MERKLINILFLLLLISCSKDEDEIQQSNWNPFNITDAYKYPILPGTDEWKKFGSTAEMVEACQIPAEILKSISTEGLLESLLNYPFVTDYIFSDILQIAFNNIKNENKGFAELYSRNDVFKVVTERYKSMSLDKGKIYPPYFLGEPSANQIAFQTYEFFIFQDEFLVGLNENQQSEVFNLVYEKLQKKIEHNFSEYSKLLSCAILGKIMYRNNYIPFVEICTEKDFMKYFIEEIPMYRPESIMPVDIIEEYAKKYKESKGN